MSDVPLRDHITPHYVHLGLLKFRNIVKIYNCLFLYHYVSDNKPCNFPPFLVSEQHNYFTRSASAQQLHIPHSRINIRKFCPFVIGKYFWNELPLSIRNKLSKILFKKALKNIILLNIDLCACVCVLNTNKPVANTNSPMFHRKPVPGREKLKPWDRGKMGQPVQDGAQTLKSGVTAPRTLPAGLEK